MLIGVQTGQIRFPFIMMVCDAGGTMTNPDWIVLAWFVVALASSVKFWSLTRTYRDKTAFSSPQTVNEARVRLERHWRKDSNT